MSQHTPAASGAGRSSTAEQELQALEASLDEARMRGDSAMFDSVLADEFRTTNPVGTVTGKAEALADARSGTLRVESSKSTDIVVRAYGQVAVVTGRATMRATYRGFDISGPYIYTHVYVKRDDGRWQVVAAHSSRRLPDWLYFVAAKAANLFRLTPE
jgi:ketosteroid isomerase-like protein